VRSPRVARKTLESIIGGLSLYAKLSAHAELSAYAELSHFKRQGNPKGDIKDGVRHVAWKRGPGSTRSRKRILGRAGSGGPRRRLCAAAVLRKTTPGSRVRGDCLRRLRRNARRAGLSRANRQPIDRCHARQLLRGVSGEPAHAPVKRTSP
jgi:hypothetical protein